MAHLSRCRGAPITIEGPGTTHWARCTCCEKPCDWVTDTAETVTNTSVLTDKHINQEDYE
jgi:hypothetical protein